MRDIVVYSPGFRHWNGGVRYAAQLAAWMQATLTGLYVAAPGGAVAGPQALAEEAIAYAQDELHQAMRVGPDFADWADRLGAREAHWQVAVGPVADALMEAAHWGDVLVLQGHAPPSSTAERLLCDVLLSGAACIVVPPGLAPGRVVRAVVGWNGSMASNRALHDALPLLRAADAVTVMYPHAVPSPGPRTVDVVAHLRARGVTVSAVEPLGESDGDVGERLLLRAADERADLLVMGAGCSRRPGGCCMGTTTSAVLSGSAVPVFLRH